MPLRLVGHRTARLVRAAVDEARRRRAELADPHGTLLPFALVERGAGVREVLVDEDVHDRIGVLGVELARLQREVRAGVLVFEATDEGEDVLVLHVFMDGVPNVARVVRLDRGGRRARPARA